MTMRRRGACLALLVSVVGLGCVVLPEAQLPDDDNQLVALEQGWTGNDRLLFYHESQGTIMVPYDWFMALEQPEIKFFGSVGMFADTEYMARYGFLPSRPVPTRNDSGDFVSPPVDCEPSDDPASVDYNCGLPVGISRALIEMPETGVREEVVGFTCAACHTGELHHDGMAIRIEGATNLVDVTQFQSALGGAMLLTQRFPFRFTRFARRVLAQRGIDEDDPLFDDERAQLRDELDAFMAVGGRETSTALRKRLYTDYPGGFGRTDALARIGNMVFGTEMNNDDNLVPGSAPVKFPAIWDAPYISWAQYNGSIEQSMVRNVGEALGVRARVVYRPGGDEWGDSGEEEYTLDSTVDVPGLFSIETLLRGTGFGYFNGLHSPVWPEQYLGDIDWDRADRGAQLYENRCRMCHLPPLADLVEVGTVTHADGTRAPGVVPRGRDVVANVLGRDGVVIGKELPVPLSAADGAPTAMYWISNNHPSMLANMVTEPFEHTEFFLNYGVVNLGTIRTDPGQAANFAKALIDTGDILLPSFFQYNGGPSDYPLRIISPGVGLQMVTIDIMTKFYDEIDAQTFPERQAFIDSLPANLQRRDARGNLVLDADGNIQPAYEMFLADASVPSGYRINREDWNGYRVPAAEANVGYRPRPLNGMWASPPYLHNGAAPSVFELLSPHEERSGVFYSGNREYDPVHLGYRVDRFRGGFRYDTRHTGNSNYGHLFQGGGPGNGVIGPYLTPDERYAIIEFLKTLCPPGTRTDRSDPSNPQLCRPLPGLPGGS
jgi:hypothetical protein